MSVLQTEQPAIVRRSGRAAWKSLSLAILITALFFAAVAPTVPWNDFSGGMENFNVETSLEMARDGHWIVPTLDGQVRTRKPPLAEWITALGILSSHSLAWGARWPSLVCACLTLLAAYELGRLTGGPTLGIVTLCICATNYLFLKFAREASYDTQLMLWVTVTNVCIAWAVVRDRWWLGCAGAGVALGLALMTKGPVAILQTVVPPVVVNLCERFVAQPPSADFDEPSRVVFRRRRKCLGEISTFGRTQPRAAVPHTTQPRAAVPHGIQPRAAVRHGRAVPRVVAPVALGVIFTLTIALPWTVLMLVKFPGRLPEWWNEMTLGAEYQVERRIGVYFAYLAFPAWLLPWTTCLLGGFWSAVRRNRPAAEPVLANQRALRLMFAWVLVPLIVMWFFPERRDRYVLPLIPSAAVVAGWGLIQYLSRLARLPPDGCNLCLWGPPGDTGFQPVPRTSQSSSKRGSRQPLVSSRVGKRLVPPLGGRSARVENPCHRAAATTERYTRPESGLSFRWPLVAHWGIVTGSVIGLPIAGAAGVGSFRTVDGEPWFSPGLATSLLIIGTIILAFCIRLKRPTVARLVGGTFMAILVVQTAVAWGYARSPNGVSASRLFVEEIRRQYPNAIVYNAVNRVRRRELPLEMTIYFNRVVGRVDDISQLKPADRPQVIVFPDGAQDPPRLFKLVTRRFIKEQWWNAYVLPTRGS